MNSFPTLKTSNMSGGIDKWILGGPEVYPYISMASLFSSWLLTINLLWLLTISDK